MLESREKTAFWIVCVLACFGSSQESCAFVSHPHGVSRTRCSYVYDYTTMWSAPDDKDNYIDAIIETETDDSSSLALPRRRKRDVLRDFLKSITELSLMDYKWRSSLFKETEADRRIEESLARMRGEDASYVRPMDAKDEKIGPLVGVFASHSSYFHSVTHFCFVSNDKRDVPSEWL